MSPLAVSMRIGPSIEMRTDFVPGTAERLPALICFDIFQYGHKNESTGNAGRSGRMKLIQSIYATPQNQRKISPTPNCTIKRWVLKNTPIRRRRKHGLINRRKAFLSATSPSLPRVSAIIETSARMAYNASDFYHFCPILAILLAKEMTNTHRMG